MHWLLFGLLTLFVVNGIRRMTRETEGAPTAPPPFQKKPQEATKQVEVQETSQCPLCKAYVTRSAPPCDRADCPLGGNK